MHVTRSLFFGIGFLIVVVLCGFVSLITWYVSESTNATLLALLLTMVISTSVTVFVYNRIHKRGYWDNDIMNSYKEL